MWPVSARFVETVAGSHLAVARARLLRAVPQYGSDPDGDELPILDGDVRMSATADVKATATLTIPGDWWDLVQPFGSEVFLERGVAFGDGTREFVPLGYFRVDEASQDSAPHGPVVLTLPDRTVQLKQNRTIYPFQVPAGSTHRWLVDRLVNGRTSQANAPSTEGYAMYIHTAMPIVWDRAGYDPDTSTVAVPVTVDGDIYDFLAKLLDGHDCVIRFRPTGELAIEQRAPALDAPAEHVLRDGATGTLVRASRKVTRDGVYNIVRASSSDPAANVGYRLAYLSDERNPLRWDGPFGAAPRYFASPLLQSSAAADAAAETLLQRTTGLPSETSLWAVPNPALQPLDVVDVAQMGQPTVRHSLDEVTVPLVSGQLQVRTRALHPVAPEVTPGPDPDPLPGPDPDPGPGPGPGPSPGGGDPSDGTQAAVLLGWGSRVDGDEFDYTGPPRADKWSMYDGPGHAGNGLRRPAAFSVHDGICTIFGDNIAGGTTGGMAFKSDTYGYRVEVRTRAYSVNPNAGGNRYHPVWILWPSNNQWPQGAEYDFYECNCDSGKFELFMHLPNHTPYRQDYASKPLDIQNWHNVACEWNPAARTLKTWVDGVLVYDGRGRVAEAPGPMHLTFQLDNFYGGNMTPAKFDAQWVRIYQRPNA